MLRLCLVVWAPVSDVMRGFPDGDGLPLPHPGLEDGPLQVVSGGAASGFRDPLPRHTLESLSTFARSLES